MITVPTLRKGLDLPADKDIDLTRIRNEVVALWEEETGLLWDYRDSHLEIFTPRGIRNTRVYSTLVPVDNILLIRERSEADTSWTELESDDYQLIGRRTIRRIGGFWKNLVEVTVQGGAREADADIQRVLILQARFELARFDDKALIVQSQNFEGGAGSYMTATMHPEFKRLAKKKARKG